MAIKLFDDAKDNPNDEFYTLLETIEKEMKYYHEQFHGKVILCNCDDPYESNFFKYFAMNFNRLGLKQLICTCYDGSPVAGTQLSLFDLDDNNENENNKKNAYFVKIDHVTDLNNDGAIDLEDVELLLKTPGVVHKLIGNGDFKSKECLELLDMADIVVTNPPFSKYRVFVQTLMEHNKKFLIIGNTNALTYKETFEWFKADKIRTGYTNFNTGMFFMVPDSFQKYHHIDENGKKIARVSTSCWFTNLEVKKHQEDLILYKTYNPIDYPKYDNYDAINVNKYNEIPIDYDGMIGVPITFLDKYNPNQFEIIATTTRNDNSGLRHKIYTSADAPNFGDLNGAPVLNENGTLKTVYARILIKKRG